VRKLVVGCPVANRSWVLRRWIDHVLVACGRAELEPEFLFVVPLADDELLRIIVDGLGASSVDLIVTDEDPLAARRDWNDMGRLHHMVDLRSRLLRRVREIQPDLFWSLDSDMLAAPDALEVAIRCLDRESWAAVGMRTFMQPVGTGVASKANLVNGRLVSREDVTYGAHRVDVIMGSKLMTPPAYEIDYEFHPKGEDVGWSVSVAAHGLQLGWCAEACVKHVMSPEYLDAIDDRVGF